MNLPSVFAQEATIPQSQQDTKLEQKWTVDINEKESRRDTGLTGRTISIPWLSETFNFPRDEYWEFIGTFSVTSKKGTLGYTEIEGSGSGYYKYKSVINVPHIEGPQKCFPTMPFNWNPCVRTFVPLYKDQYEGEGSIPTATVTGTYSNGAIHLVLTTDSTISTKNLYETELHHDNLMSREKDWVELITTHRTNVAPPFLGVINIEGEWKDGEVLKYKGPVFHTQVETELRIHGPEKIYDYFPA